MTKESNAPDNIEPDQSDSREASLQGQNLEDEVRNKQYNALIQMIDDGMSIFEISDHMQLSIHEIDAILLRIK